MNSARKISLVFISMLIFALTSAQTYLTGNYPSFYQDSLAEPESEWNKLGYNDSAWSEGIGVLGYGDKYNTKIEEAQTVYSRSNFTVESVEDFEDAVLICDFDDGFVAYINGVEFARVNMGAYGTKTSYEQLADRSHEAELYRNLEQLVLGYYIDKAFIDSVFIEGANVLAIEVHNDSINGSDLILSSQLYNLTGVDFTTFNITDRYKKCVELDSTLLPIIKIESNEFGIPYKRIEVPATIEIIDNGNGKYNKPEDPVNGHKGPIQIEVRGESSAYFPKRPYDIELQDAEAKDTSVSLLGMPRESDWILQGPFADKSQIRNAVIYELGRKTGHYTPRIQFCELILNGEYLGLYNLTEKIKRDSNRVNIGKLRETEISGTDLTGGYILKYDKPGGLQIVYPKASKIQAEQEEYILDYIESYQTTLNSEIGLDPEIGYKKYIDETSLIDYIIICEFGKICDAYRYSSFFYKDKIDRDSRIKFGPLWDFDLCFGNSIWNEGDKTEGWQFDYPVNKEFMIQRLFEDEELVDLFEDRWFELREGSLHLDSLYAMIDSLTTLLAAPLERNYKVWPIESEGIFFPAYISTSYENEIDILKAWIYDRLTWMDVNIGNIYYPLTEYSTSNKNLFAANSNFEAKIYPNPFSSEFMIELTIPESGNLLVELIDIQGKATKVIESSAVDKGSYKVYWAQSGGELDPGLYLISIRINGKLYLHIKALHIK